MKKLIIILILISTSFTICKGDDDSLKYTIAPYFEFMLIHHEPRFNNIPEIEYCCQTQSEINNGNGIGFGLKYELSLPNRTFLGLKFGLNNFTAKMASPESILIREDDHTSNIFIRHYNNSDFLVFLINPYFKLKLIENISIYFGAYASPFLSKKYEIYEKVESPINYIYDDTKTNVRNYQSKNYKSEKGLWSGFNFGISYDIFLWKNTLFISPELSYNLGMNNIIQNLDWELNSLNLTLNLGYNFHNSKEVNEIRTQINKFDTVYINREDYNNEFCFGKLKIDSSKYIKNNIIETVVVYQRVDTVFRGKKINLAVKMDNQDLFVEIRKANQEFQNLDVVFFKNESSDFLNNYYLLNKPSEFQFESLEPDPIKIHYNILNIIAYRLSKNKNSNITLLGEIDSLNPNNLINERFNKIKAYLNNTWGINPDRIKTEIKISRNQNSKNKYDQRFIEENNKIKIIPNNKDVFEPIKKNNFYEIKTFYPEKLNLYIDGVSNLDLNNYHLILYQNLNIIKEQKDNKKKNDFIFNLNDSLINSIDLAKPIEITYITELNDKKKLIANDSIKINKKMLNEKVSRLALIFFDFDSDKIQNTSLEQINELTKYITNKSTIIIKGYTDNIGTAQYNKELSLKRAKNVSDLILKYQPKATIKSIEGFGSEVYTNGITSFNSPIERYLSRTVVIEIFDEIY